MAWKVDHNGNKQLIIPKGADLGALFLEVAQPETLSATEGYYILMALVSVLRARHNGRYDGMVGSVIEASEVPKAGVVNRYTWYENEHWGRFLVVADDADYPEVFWDIFRQEPPESESEWIVLLTWTAYVISLRTALGDGLCPTGVLYWCETENHDQSCVAREMKLTARKVAELLEAIGTEPPEVLNAL